MSWRLLKLNAREHLAIYALASVSNLLLSVPEYLAVHSGVVSYLPVQGSTAWLIATYGAALGVLLDSLWTALVFQGLLAVFVLAIAGSSSVGRGWRWLYVMSGTVVAGFVGYWLGAKFVRTLDWISFLQNSGIDISSVYSDLFWFGLGATGCYVGMILLLRRTYWKLTEIRTAKVGF